MMDLNTLRICTRIAFRSWMDSFSQGPCNYFVANSALSKKVGCGSWAKMLRIGQGKVEECREIAVVFFANEATQILRHQRANLFLGKPAPYVTHAWLCLVVALLSFALNSACKHQSSPVSPPSPTTTTAHRAPLSVVPEFTSKPATPQQQDDEAPINPISVNLNNTNLGSTSTSSDLVWLSHPTLPFSITATEISVQQFKSCVMNGKCIPQNRKPCNFGVEGKENHPMNCINYYGAEEFCHFAGGRICTETEWLAACSGSNGRAFPYGNEFDISVCNHQSATSPTSAKPKDTAPVKSFGQCEGGLPGLFDMAGNVTEWVNGCKDDYCKFRGGGFVNNDPVERFTGCSGVCSGNKKGFLSPTIGIRCCRDAD